MTQNKKSKGLQKLTINQTKINKVLALNQITPDELNELTDPEKDRLMEILTEQFNQLKGTERDRFYNKIETITSETTKNQLWESNHNQITWAISTLMKEYGRMPTKSEIAIKSELSRQTIHKHLKDYKSHPLFMGELEQFRFMTSKVLAKVFHFAVNGDIGAAKLYFNVMGYLNNGSPKNSFIQSQNNFIQINQTIVSQETIKQLAPDQLLKIEQLLKELRLSTDLEHTPS